MPTLRRRQFQIETAYGGGIVAGIEAGPGSRPLDVLLLHANGFNAFTYSPILRRLAASHRVLAVDLRGHGLTRLNTPAPPPGWRLYADDLLALLHATGEQPRVLAGHSMGGTTALLAAPGLPRIRSLVLFDPVILPAPAYKTGLPDMTIPMAQAAMRRNAHFASREDAAAAYRGRGAFRTWPEAFLHAYLQDGLTPLPEGGFTLSCTPSWEAANFASYGMADPSASLAGIAARVTILRAAQGSTCALAELPGASIESVPSIFIESVPGISIESVPGTTHFLPMEQPERCVAALIAAASL